MVLRTVAVLATAVVALLLEAVFFVLASVWGIDRPAVFLYLGAFTFKITAFTLGALVVLGLLAYGFRRKSLALGLWVAGLLTLVLQLAYHPATFFAT